MRLATTIKLALLLPCRAALLLAREGLDFLQLWRDMQSPAWVPIIRADIAQELRERRL